MRETLGRWGVLGYSAGMAGGTGFHGARQLACRLFCVPASSPRVQPGLWVSNGA